MKVLSIDLGSYKTVMASSDTSAGEVILNKVGGRSTKMAIDYRNKVRVFGNINVTCKGREKVAEDIRSEIEEFAAQIKEKEKALNKLKIPSTSHIYALLSNLITYYAKSKGITTSEIEVEIVVPATYTQLHKDILVKIVNMINPKIAVECITDSIALCLYYLSRRPTEKNQLVSFVDIGDSKSTITAACITSDHLRVISRETVPVGGRNITNHLFTKIYGGLDRTIPDLFSEKEFRIRNMKKIEWIKGALFGLPSVSTQVDASYDKSVGVTITHADIKEVLQEFAEFKTKLEGCNSALQQFKKTMENKETEPEEFKENIEVEITGGASRIFFIEEIIQSIFKTKPEVHLNADEAVALGGVYRRLMQSSFHRFKYDPLIEDITDSSYYILVTEKGVDTRKIDVFEAGAAFVKEKKSKVLAKKYDTTVVLKQSPRKTVKITKVSDKTQMTLFSGGYPVCRIVKKPAESSNTSEAPAPEEKEKDKKTVKLTVSLSCTGAVDAISDDVEIVSVLDTLNFSVLKKTEDTYIQRENAVAEIEGRVNTVQSGMFSAIELLSGDLSDLPSAESVTAELWEYTQTVEGLAATAQTLQEVIAFEETVEKKLSLESEWNKFASGVIKRFMAEHKIELQPPKYPGLLHLFSINTYAANETQKELDRRERIRKYEEQKQREQEEAKERQKQQEDQNINQEERAQEQEVAE